MNDFTKEELEDLYYAMRYFWKNRERLDLPSDDDNFTHSYDLMVKAGKMIDNYCEHEWRIGGADCIACTKCEKEVFYL